MARKLRREIRELEAEVERLEAELALARGDVSFIDGVLETLQRDQRSYHTGLEIGIYHGYQAGARDVFEGLGAMFITGARVSTDLLLAIGEIRGAAAVSRGARRDVSGPFWTAARERLTAAFDHYDAWRHRASGGDRAAPETLEAFEAFDGLIFELREALKRAGEDGGEAVRVAIAGLDVEHLSTVLQLAEQLPYGRERSRVNEVIARLWRDVQADHGGRGYAVDELRAVRERLAAGSGPLAAAALARVDEQLAKKPRVVSDWRYNLLSRDEFS